MNEQTESLNPDKNEETGEKLVASQPAIEGESAAEPVVDEAAEAAVRPSRHASMPLPPPIR
jgi:hypothetical protein